MPPDPEDRAAAYDAGGDYRELVEGAADDLFAWVTDLHACHPLPWWW